MATIEKLIKAFEALKVFQPGGNAGNDDVKKKEQVVSKKDKMTYCSMVADCICAPNMRAIIDFPKFLGIAMETFLSLCDDRDSDVRMVADECLNRSIKVLLETNLGRLQVEMYKEIKKNGSSRTLRAALWRFAELAHLIRPQKCRPYVVNLLPCLARICKRPEEAVQETLLAAMTKICPVLVAFANESEIKVLLKSFLPNLKSSSATGRRTAANSLVLICQHSRSRLSFYTYLLNILLDMVLPIDGDNELYTLQGVLVCLRLLIPHLHETDSLDHGLKGSFGVVTKEKSESVNAEQLSKIIQVLVYLMQHSDNNVVTGSLEAFQQLLKNPFPLLTQLLTQPGAMQKSLVLTEDLLASSTNLSLQEIPSFSKFSEDSGLDDDASEVLTETEIESTNGTEMSSAFSNLESAIIEEQDSVDAGGDGKGSAEEVDLDSVCVTGVDDEYTDIEVGSVNDDNSESCDLDRARRGSQETLESIQSLSPIRKPSFTMSGGQDLNGNPEVEEVSEADSGEREKVPMEGLGELIGEGVPLHFCVRFICRQFLLGGTKGSLIPDRTVRVSIKSLALGSVSYAVSLQPEVFLLGMITGAEEDVKDDSQTAGDLLLYGSHPDPQLKGWVTQLVSNFVNTALRESRGDFFSWLANQQVDRTGQPVRLESLLDLLLVVLEDASSVAVRHALHGLQNCIPSLLHSVHCDLGLWALVHVLQVNSNPYWLVKVELLELLSNLDFKVISHLESCCVSCQKGNHHYLGRLDLQKKVVCDILVPMLGDEDMRVRHAAALCFVKLVPRLFFAVDHSSQDPVVATAKDQIDMLRPQDFVQDFPPLVQGLVQPFSVGTKQAHAFVESSLSRVVTTLFHQLALSQTKHMSHGCLHALCLLSEVYHPTVYFHAWACGQNVPLLTKEKTSKMIPKRPPSRSLSTSSTFSLDDVSLGSGGGALSEVISLLTSSNICYDLTSHHDALQLSAALVSGAIYKSLRVAEDYSPSDSTEESRWQGVSDRVLVPLIEQFLSHIARLLNIFSHVIDETVPGPPQIKPSLPSLPNAPSLSPIKRKAKGEKEAPSSATSTPTSAEKSTKQQKEKEKEPEKDKNKKDGLGTFYNLPQYMKFFDVLKSAYSTYKVSLDMSASDKFCTLLKTTLTALSQILEVTTLLDIGKHSEEFLGYLKSTVTLEPMVSILCVQQLLKALFGTNLVSQWECESSGHVTHRPGKTVRLSGNSKPGLYYYCFTQPYSHFTQSLASAAFKASSHSDQEDTLSSLNWLRKCIERKVPAILKPGSKVDKSAIGAYIRLFEPLVIKALKQYTVSSCLDLQRQVLDLLTQLIQLRVNYCLLDSDQVFIKFILRQIELIEEGHIRSSDRLIPNLFNFLVMLSYEKYHSKAIIGMPKIIQLCDGIMASGLHPVSHAIPALKPIVYDLFLLRAANKSDVGKELETQREVLVSMLLRLIPFCETFDLFIVILQQCHKESEDKWKRLSRQIIDTIIPALMKQQVNVDHMTAMNTLHKLFECVAPIVFRPVDILLKSLLQKPVDLGSVEGLQRWMCLVLSILKVLMAQSKEDVLLSRMQELNVKLCILKDPEGNQDPLMANVVSMTPENTIASFLLQVVGKCVTMIRDKHATDALSVLFLKQQLSHFLLCMTHMFQSGLFRKVATSAMQTCHKQTNSQLYNLPELNQMFLNISSSIPTLTLQWCNILILLNFNDPQLWGEVMQTPKRSLKPGMSPVSEEGRLPMHKAISCNSEILRRGGLILFCDYACENLMDAEHLTWLVINHVRDIIDMSQESPVQDFISAIHRNAAASSLFIQAIHARCDHEFKPSLVKKTMKCLEAIHINETGSLLTLLVDKFLGTHQLAVARLCDTIACKRVETLLSNAAQNSKDQTPSEDLDKLLQHMIDNKLTKRHARLHSLLLKLRGETRRDSQDHVDQPHPVLIPSSVSDIVMDKDMFVMVTMNQCYMRECNMRECAKLLSHLSHADVLSIAMTKEFNLSILKECLTLGGHKTLIKCNSTEDGLDPGTKPIPREPDLDPLFQSAQLTLLRNINNVVNHLPVPHQVYHHDDVDNSSRSAHRNLRYIESMEDLFSDTSWQDEVLTLTSVLNEYLVTLMSFPWQHEIPADSVGDICRFCVLSSEIVSSQLHRDQLPTSQCMNACLSCVDLVLQHPLLSSVIGGHDNTSWVCALVTMVYQTFHSLMVKPKERLVSKIELNKNADQRLDTLEDFVGRACDQISELVEVLNEELFIHSSKLPSFLQTKLKNITIGLSRQPILNSYARTPPMVWKMGWIPSPTGETKTQLPPLPVDYIQDKEVLKEYVSRINSIGWIHRQQFEETWMSLLAVVNPVTSSLSSGEGVMSLAEDIEKSQCTVMAVKAITSLLLQSTLVPMAGNHSNSVYDMRPRDKPLGFLHTRCGKKLTTIRGLIEHEMQLLLPVRNGHVQGRPGREDGDYLRYMFDNNLEREIGENSYMLGQISVESLWAVVGAINSHTVESDTTDSPDSTSLEPSSPETPSKRRHFPMVSLKEEKRERTHQRSDVDVHSCLQFLLELFTQWMSPSASPKPPLMLKTEVVKLILSLSDLFYEREQFEWMLETLMDLQKLHPPEDEIISQYILVGVCKAAAVYGVDGSAAEKIIKIIEQGFKSPHLSSRTATLHGTLYFLEAGIQDINKQLLPLTTDFLLKNLATVSHSCITSQKYILTMWATAFYIMENYHIDLRDLEFPIKILQMAVSTASSNEDSVSTCVYLAILRGLERLLLTDVLSKQDAEAIIKLAVDRLCIPSPQRSLAALGLMFTCMYSGKQYDQYSPLPRDTEPSRSVYDFKVIYQDPESLILAMERVTVLFDRIKKGYPFEARIIARVLPQFLADFFPPQDIMNKVIGEFISSQQPYPQLIANIVFKVFNNLQEHGQQALVQDWVMLSLSNFTQRTPVAMAMWSQTCFFISASTNKWLKALFDHMIRRMGRMEAVDQRMFCVAALDFYTQLSEDTQKRAFVSTFQMVAEPASVYQTLLDYLH